MDFKVVQKEIELQSRGWIPTFHDISTDVMKIVAESGIKNGTVAIVSHHTTCSVMVQECSHDFDTFDLETDNLNDRSMIVKITAEDTSLLVTGDAEIAEEEYLLTRYSAELDADLLKVAHHGSNTSSTYDFVSAVSPQYAIISCASDADTEYPHVETAMTLYDCGIEDVFLTSTSGNITIETSPTGELSIASELSQK